MTPSYEEATTVTLSTQYLNGAIGNPSTGARLSWQITPTEPGRAQIAYQIESRSSGNDWVPREEVASSQSIAIPTEDILSAYQSRDYRVRVKTEEGWTGYSNVVTVATGPLKLTGKVITSDSVLDGPAPVFRREFEVAEIPPAAFLSFSALGVADVYINGEKANDTVLSPGWTAYNDRVLYETIEVTDLLRTGTNAISVIVADGWYRGRFGFADRTEIYGSEIGAILQIDAVDGDKVIPLVQTDSSWRAGFGPVQLASIYDGSTIDFTQEAGDPSQAGFADSHWDTAEILDVIPSLFQPREDTPVRVIDSFPMELSTFGDAVRLTSPQNVSGWVKLRVSGKRGDRVVVTHAEVCHPDGRLFTEALRTAKATDTYILGDDGEFVLEPVHTFHGFQFADVRGEAQVLSAEAIAISSQMPKRSFFKSGLPELNQLHSNVYWSLRDNFVSVPTDCPQRDERMGWTGDAQAFAPTASTLVDSEQFWINWMRDLELDQDEDGAVAAVVPNIIFPEDMIMGDGPQNSMGRAGWADAVTILPFAVYDSFGSSEILERSLESMRRWIGYLESNCDGVLLREGPFQFGDWLDPDAPTERPWDAKVSKDFVANAFYLNSVRLLAEAEQLVGDPQQVPAIMERADQLSAAIWEKWRDEAYSTQTGASLALQFGIAPEAEIPAVAAALAQNVRTEKGRIATGFLGTPLILFALSENGYVDEALTMLLRREAPSWLYQIDRGATTIWERWDAILPDGSLNSGDMDTREGDTMTSFNHYAYGAVLDWIYRNIAGISPVRKTPGYERILVAPKPSQEVGSAEASIETRLGRAGIAWELLPSGDLQVELVIPNGATADLQLPLTEKSELRGDVGTGTSQVGPGTHRFTVTDPQVYSPV